MKSRRLFNVKEFSSRLAAHVAASTPSSTWRENLILEGIFDAEEVNSFSETELTLIQRTLLTTRYLTMSEEQLLSAMQDHGLPWRVDLDTDYSAAAVAY